MCACYYALHNFHSSDIVRVFEHFIRVYSTVFATLLFYISLRLHSSFLPLCSTKFTIEEPVHFLITFHFRFSVQWPLYHNISLHSYHVTCIQYIFYIYSGLKRPNDGKTENVYIYTDLLRTIFKICLFLPIMLIHSIQTYTHYKRAYQYQTSDL